MGGLGERHISPPYNISIVDSSEEGVDLKIKSRVKDLSLHFRLFSFIHFRSDEINCPLVIMPKYKYSNNIPPNQGIISKSNISFPTLEIQTTINIRDVSLKWNQSTKDYVKLNIGWFFSRTCLCTVSYYIVVLVWINVQWIDI